MTLLQQQHQRLRRVVVTGIGAVTPLGVTFVQTWQQLCDGHCGVTTLMKALRYQNQTDEHFERDVKILQPLSCQVAAAVPKFQPPKNINKNTSRVAQFALTAVAEAIQSAQLTNWWGNDEECQHLKSITNLPIMKANDVDDNLHVLNRRRQRTGVSIGTGMSGVQDIVHAVRTLDDGGGGNIRKISPHLVPTILGNSASSRVAIQYGLRGPNVSATTACAAGSHAIGDAVRYIQSNMADVMIAGGAESCIDPLSLIAFHRLRAISTQFNREPELASRPFDRKRDGFVMGEGACVLILEEMDHAIQRFNGIPPSLRIIPSRIQYIDENTKNELKHDRPFWIEVCGYGATGDAHHITSPDPSGRGAIEAMQQSLLEATINNTVNPLSDHHHNNVLLHVDYVNAHATSTPIGDEIEARAIRTALQYTTPSTSSIGNIDRRQPTYVSSTKGATGHLLGAAGAIEAAFTIQSLVEQTIIPTLNLTDMLSLEGENCTASSSLSVLPDSNEVVFVQGEKAMPCPPGGELTVAMSNSFGFGGTNSSLTFRRTQS